jgi:hypothetical protein
VVAGRECPALHHLERVGFLLRTDS